MEKNLNVETKTKIVRAANERKWEEMLEIMEEQEISLTSPITVIGDTVFHYIVLSKKKDLVQKVIQNLIPHEHSSSSPLRIQNSYGNTALHETVTTNCIEIAQLLLDKDPDLLTIKNKAGETPLFRAAAFKRTKMFPFLLSHIEHNQIESHMLSKDTSLLHLALRSQCFDIVLLLLKRPDVDPYGEAFTQIETVTCLQVLANMPKVFMSNHSTFTGLFAKTIYDYFVSNSDTKDKQNAENNDFTPKNQMTDLERGPTTRNLEVTGRSISIWKWIIKNVPTMKKFVELQNTQRKVEEITEFLVERDFLSWKQSSKLSKEPEGSKPLPGIIETTQSSPNVESNEDSKMDEDSIHEIPLIAAAKNGITEIVEAIIDKYPQATEYTNENLENLCHSVASHRHTRLLELLLKENCRKGTVPITRINNKITRNGETLWHKAAGKGGYSSVGRPGHALFLQSEIQWFKQVRKLLPDHLERYQNDINLTAEQLFTRQHIKVVKKGQEWLSRTTEACGIVAVLIATVAYTCAYTVPGGTDHNTGKPVLLKKTAFTIFTFADTISLFFALTSVVFFLSILTSKMQEQDFWLSLPLKLVFGFTTLFFAVTSMMVAFASTLVLTIRHRLQWATIPVYIIAALPVTVFLVLQLPLYLDIAWFSIKDLLWSLKSYFPSADQSPNSAKNK